MVGSMTLDEHIQKLVDERVEKALEEKIPLIIRAIGIKDAAEPDSDGYVDALEVARFLGRDLSSPENILKAKRHVYNLARTNRIPSIRISERNLKFDLAKVKEALKSKEQPRAA
jgi:hypothetical protein